MATQTPSLYPRPTSSRPSSNAQTSPHSAYESHTSELPTAPPEKNPTDGLFQDDNPPNMQAERQKETLPPDYELLLEIEARLSEVPHPAPTSPSANTKLKQPVTGRLRVIQGPLPPSTPEQSADTPYYHAFVSLSDVNIPLMPSCGASRPAPSAFYLSIPDHTFLVEPDARTEVELLDSLERLLRWFCQWQVVTDGGAPVALPSEGQVEVDGQPGKIEMSQRLTKVGDKGVLFVERVGSAINRKINQSLEQRRDAIQEDNSRQVKLGGKVTLSVLSTTRKVLGTGASVASKITDRISSAVGSAMTDTAVSRNMANAPEGSLKRGFYDNLMAGALVFGRVYVEADKQGKIIIEDAGNRMSDIARRKYGNEAEAATRHISHIALDGYRIARFPQKLGATSIVKGAFKSKFATSSHVSANEPPFQDISADGVPRYFPHGSREDTPYVSQDGTVNPTMHG